MRNAEISSIIGWVIWISGKHTNKKGNFFLISLDIEILLLHHFKWFCDFYVINPKIHFHIFILSFFHYTYEAFFPSSFMISLVISDIFIDTPSIFFECRLHLRSWLLDIFSFFLCFSSVFFTSTSWRRFL